MPGELIWKGVSSVSNAGKKRGRARQAGKGLTKDLNRGQHIGKGRMEFILPGLNTSTFKGTQITQPQRGENNPNWYSMFLFLNLCLKNFQNICVYSSIIRSIVFRDKELHEIRDQRRNRKKMIQDPSERGYSGRRLPGKSVGAPDPIGEYHFDGFDTRAVEFKIVNTMRGNLGRFRRHSAYVVTGNGNGVAGFAMGKSTDPKAAIRKAKNRAAQKLMHIQVCDGHTVFHDYFCQFGQTKIFVSKKPRGYGLRTHRVIKTICELIGIKDLHARIEGATGVQHIVKAFFLGLLQQKTYDQMAEEKKLYLVEFRKDNNHLPQIVGVPSHCRKSDEIPKSEELDFKQYVMNGKVRLQKKHPPRFYAEYHSYKIFLRRAEKRRSHEPIKFDLFTRYGEYRSFLTDKYPEAKAGMRIIEKE